MKIVIVIFVFLLTIVLAFVYVRISSPINESFINSEISDKLSLKKQEIKNPLIYHFPARVLFMKIDLRNYKKMIVYKISLNIKDRFSIFNIKALLENANLHYTMFNNAKEIIIYVNFKNLKEAKRFFDLFKEYNFNVKLIKQIKRI